MFFRKSEPSQPGRGKRKSKPPKQSSQSKSSRQAQKPPRRLDSVTLQIPPPALARRSSPVPQRGAPLSPETQWLLDKMSRLSDIDNYALFKEPFIALYISNPAHHPGSADRAFYSAVQTCKRRLRSGRTSS